uniref:Uncharacterized protein n=1 Tax=Anguilla anguilla TaxID=7936 RepID=A0A0E9W0M4_ANGAN
MNKINLVVFLIVGLQVAGIEMWQNGYDKKLHFTCSGRDSISMITSKT